MSGGVVPAVSESAADQLAIDALWAEVLATGRLPAAATLVRDRLVRSVGTARLPSGAVFLKVMAFPRWKDRLRYLLRPLPAAHEAAMLARVAAAGVPCPEVLAVRTARRGLWPHRSLLVLRALAVAGEPRVDAAVPGPSIERVVQLAECAALAVRLRDLGLCHPDLNPDNFVRLADGRLAVLDLQSAHPVWSRRRAGRAMAARLLLETALEPAAALPVLAEAGLVVFGDRGLVRMAMATARTWLRQRVRRCLQTSSDFERRRIGVGAFEHRRRGELPPGRWRSGGQLLRRAWLGQRLLEVLEGRPPVLFAFRCRWSWLPGPRSVYIAATVPEEREPDVLRGLAEAHARLRRLLADPLAADLRRLQRWRAGKGSEDRR